MRRGRSTWWCPIACGRSTMRCSRSMSWRASRLGRRPDPAVLPVLRRERSQPAPRPSQLLHAAPPAAPAVVPRPRSAARARATWGTTHSSPWSTPTMRRCPTQLRQLGLDLLCTNRDLPMSMPVGKQHTDFTVAVNAPIASIRCLVGADHAAPVPQRWGTRLALHLASRAELPQPDRYRPGAGRGGAARVAAALSAGQRYPCDAAA